MMSAWRSKDHHKVGGGPNHWWVAGWSLLLALCSLPVLQEGAQAEWYLGAYGGVTMPHATGFRQPSSSVHTNFSSDLNFSNGAIGGVKFGNYFLAGGLFESKWVGLEAEVLYARPSFQSQTLTADSTSTAASSGPSLTAVIPHTGLGMLGGTLNVMFRYPGMYILPYVGVGLGGVHFSSAETGLGSVDSNKLLVNLMVGLEVKLTEQFGVLVEFKHLISNFEFQSGNNTSTFQTENLVGGLAWHF